MKIHELFESSYASKVTDFASDDVGQLKKLLLEKREQIEVALKNYHEGKVIYRGVKSEVAGMLVDPTKTERLAANTFNLVNMMVSEIIPDWKPFPKRNKSLICTTAISKAFLYHTPYVVLPIGNPDIGIAPTSDFWDAFDVSPSYINEIIYLDLETIFSDLKLPPLSHSGDTKEEVISDLKTINDNYQLIRNYLDKNKDYRILDKLDMISENSFIDGMFKMYSATKNKFSLSKLSSMPTLPYTEVWFSGPALLINANLAKEIID